VLVSVSLLFGWILSPFWGAILWAAVIAIVFAPLQRRLLHAVGGRRTIAALAALLIIVVMVILPLAAVTALLVDEVSGVYETIRSREWNVGRYFQQVLDALPAWAASLLRRLGLSDLRAVQERLSAAFMQSSQFLAGRVVSIGQSTFQFAANLFVTLYLLFFLLRDGDTLFRRITATIPLHAEHQHALVEKFTTVVRATVKGDLVVAVAQGALGGLIFWLLDIHAALVWAVVMAVFSLLPAVGTALVWWPAAILLMVSGAVWQGVVLIAYGVLVIGLVDNVLRPMLVGKDTRMPDYVVLISTLGGIAIFGVNGFLVGPLIAAMFIAAWDIVSASSERRRSDC
jgi:predicted PurR-regulated permease PerM